MRKCVQKVPSTMPGPEVGTHNIRAIIIMLLNQYYTKGLSFQSSHLVLGALASGLSFLIS